MPRLQTLKFQFSVRGLIRAIASGNGGLDLGLGNLPSLQQVNVHLDSESASNEGVDELEAALMHAIEIHPNDLIIPGCTYRTVGEERRFRRCFTSLFLPLFWVPLKSILIMLLVVVQ